MVLGIIEFLEVLSRLTKYASLVFRLIGISLIFFFEEYTKMHKYHIMSNLLKQFWSVSSAGISITQSYLTFSPFEDLVSQELMVVVDIGLHLLLHSRPRDFFFFFFSPSNHVGIWLRPFMLIQMFKLRWILIKYEVFQRTEYYMSYLTDNISRFLRKQVKSEYDYVIHNYVCILKKLAALRMT